MKLFILTLLFSVQAFAFDIPPLSGPVMDQAGVLSASDKAELESMIRSVYQEGKGPQINILTIPSLKGSSIEEFGNQVFTSWKLGDEKRDDGVLFLIAPKDRKMRIEVGQGLEGALPDVYAKSILSSLRGEFKREAYGDGIKKGLSQIITIVSKERAVQMPVGAEAPVLTPQDPVDFSSYLLAGAVILFVSFTGFLGVLTFDNRKELKEVSNTFVKAKATLDSLTSKMSKEVVENKFQKIRKDLGVRNELLIDELDQVEKKQKSSDHMIMSVLKEERRRCENLLRDTKYQIEKHKEIVKKGRS